MKYPRSPLYTTFSLLFLFLFCGVFVAFALDVVDTNFSPQSALSSGSNNSQVSFSTGAASTGTTSYWNKNNDSDTIGNYLRGYYYDTQFGFFRLDWSADATQNVHIISSTDKCGTGYGYKFGGYAQSDTAGFIKFDSDANNFVYYCESDKKLHGWAYSEHLGFQSFEGITFSILSLSQNTPTLSSGTGGDPFFVNNNSLILMGLPSSTENIQGKSIVNKA